MTGLTALLFISYWLFFFFLAHFIAVMFIVSICRVCNFGIVATFPSMPAARFASCLCFIRFVFVVHSCFVW